MAEPLYPQLPPQTPPPMTAQDVNGRKLAAGLCGILLGCFGIHKFILGMTTPGIILLLSTVLTCGAGAAVTSIIGLVEGIIYLTRTDPEFYQTYIVGKKEWF